MSKFQAAPASSHDDEEAGFDVEMTASPAAIPTPPASVAPAVAASDNTPLHELNRRNRELKASFKAASTDAYTIAVDALKSHFKAPNKAPPSVFQGVASPAAARMMGALQKSSTTPK